MSSSVKGGPLPGNQQLVFNQVFKETNLF